MVLWFAAGQLALALLTIGLAVYAALILRAARRYQRGTRDEVRRLRRGQEDARADLKRVLGSFGLVHGSMEVLARMIQHRPSVELERVDWMGEEQAANRNGAGEGDA